MNIFWRFIEIRPDGSLCRLAISTAVVLLVVAMGSVDARAQSQPVNSRLSGSGIPLSTIPVDRYCTGYLGPTPEYFQMVSLDMAIVDPTNNIRDEDFEAAWSYADVYVQAPLDMTGEWRCNMNAYIDGVYVGHWTETWSWYLIVLDITINTFIPDQHYGIPGFLTGIGDDRGWNRWGSVRTAEIDAILQPNTPNYLHIENQPIVGLSELFDISGGWYCGVPDSLDGNGRLKAEALADWAWGCPYRLEWAYPPGATLYCATYKNSDVSMYLHCTGNEATPLLSFAPGITYGLFIDFWYTAQGVEFLVRGAHDGFPNYEIYVGNQLIYTHDHRAWGQTIASLGPPMEFAGVFVPGWVQ